MYRILADFATDSEKRRQAAELTFSRKHVIVDAHIAYYGEIVSAYLLQD